MPGSFSVIHLLQVGIHLRIRRDRQQLAPRPTVGIVTVLLQQGRRLRKESLAVTVGGLDIDAFCRKSVTQALDFVDRLELTEIDHDFDGDTRFPDWDRSRFTETARESHLAPEGWAYHFVTYTAKTASIV